MKPAQIRVFDGLRLTTEHLEHLQQSMISGLQDLREIAGAGAVCRGLDVVPIDKTTIAVQPGLAFDLQKNRVVIDEPRNVAVSFAPDATRVYICVKHDTVEDGEVEGHYTMLWDSGTIVSRPVLPDVKENLIPIAEIEVQSDGTLGITALGRAAMPSPTPTSWSAASGIPAKVASANAQPSADVVSAATVATAITPLLTQPEGAAPAPVSAGKSVEIIATATPATGPVAPASASRQGIEIIASDPPGLDLGGRVLAMQRSGLVGTPAGASKLRYSLFDRATASGMTVESVRCYSVVTLTISSRNVAPSSPAPAAVDAPPPANSSAASATPPGATTMARTMTVIAQGEAQLSGKALSQLGVSSAQYDDRDSARGVSTADVSQEGILVAALAPLFSGVDPGEPVSKILQPITLVLRAVRSDDGMLRIAGDLVWADGQQDAPVAELSNRVISMSWSASIGWSALGSQP